MPVGKKMLAGLADHAGLGKISPNVIKAVVAIAVAVIVISVVRWGPMANGSQGITISAATQEAAAGDGSTETSAQAPAMLVVHVTGAVNAPGVYSLEEGKRVVDAVDAAGGFAEGANTSGVNLARALSDGEQIVVPALGETSETATSAATTPSATSGSGQLVNINTATSEELQTLSGVGPATAKAIIDYREKNGRFASKEDIQQVSGIGEGKYAKICDLICV